MARQISAQYTVTRSGSIPDRIAARMRRVMFERFLSATKVTAEESILDVGATADQELEASNYLEAWYPHKDKVTACGIDDARFLEQRYPGMRFVQADGRNLPFDDGHFDVVHSSAVLEHVGSREQQAKFISELVRVARRAVFMTTPNRWYPVEFHSVLPLVHWLPAPMFRKILSGIGHQELSKEEHLNLLSAGDIRAIGKTLGLDFDVGAVRLLGWPSNLLVTIRK